MTTKTYNIYLYYRIQTRSTSMPKRDWLRVIKPILDSFPGTVVLTETLTLLGGQTYKVTGTKEQLLDLRKKLDEGYRRLFVSSRHHMPTWRIVE